MAGTELKSALSLTPHSFSSLFLPFFFKRPSSSSSFYSHFHFHCHHSHTSDFHFPLSTFPVQSCVFFLSFLSSPSFLNRVSPTPRPSFQISTVRPTPLSPINSSKREYLTTFLLLLPFLFSSQHKHRYENGDTVTHWACGKHIPRPNNTAPTTTKD